MISTEIFKRTRRDTLMKSGIEWLTKLASITKATDLDTQIKLWAQITATLKISTETQATLMRQEGDIICLTKLVGKMLRWF
jgi:hypothetical protein